MSDSVFFTDAEWSSFFCPECAEDVEDLTEEINGVSDELYCDLCSKRITIQGE